MAFLLSFSHGSPWQTDFLVMKLRLLYYRNHFHFMISDMKYDVNKRKNQFTTKK